MPSLPYPFDRRWPVHKAVQLACHLEASAPKVGNVHPNASFADTTYEHFVTSAIELGSLPCYRDANPTVGQIVLDSIAAIRDSVGQNTYLGSVLLFAPIVVAHQRHGTPSATNLANILESLSSEDAKQVYRAIQIANPGGLGKQTQHDVRNKPPEDLLVAMREVASFDAVARQYVTSFNNILEQLVPWLINLLSQHKHPLTAITLLQLRWLAYEPDGLIARKSGMPAASNIQELAQEIVQQEFPQTSIEELDQFLRSDGNRLNPGTTADMIAATLLVLLVG